LEAEVSVDLGVFVGDYGLNRQGGGGDADARGLLTAVPIAKNSTTPWPIWWRANDIFIGHLTHERDAGDRWRDKTMSITAMLIPHSARLPHMPS
jgi:hypothetical protein